MDDFGPLPGPAVVVTADLELLDRVLAATAAAGVKPQVLADAASLRPVWAAASMVIVGVDQAPQLADLVLSRRSEVFVVGEEADQEQVCAWSLPLGAAVVVLPSGAHRLTTALADVAGHSQRNCRLVAVVGGSGGVGASTCAAALAFVAAQRGLRALLVDADPLSGGLDLLVGAERVPGWRWSRLGGARGHLGDLTGHLPRVDGVDVLSMARGPRQSDPDPAAEQMQSVLLSATRSHELIVVDVPRQLTSAAREVLRRADSVFVIALAQLRGIAAAGALIAQLDDACTSMGLVVRLTRPKGLASEVVADGLGLPLVGSIVDDPSVAVGASRGDPPGRSGRSPLARSCEALLDTISPTRMSLNGGRG